MEKKRFILFGTNTYYPSGGMNDSIISFDTLDELSHEVEEDGNRDGYTRILESDRYQVFDTKHFKASSWRDSPTQAFSSLDEE